MTLDDMAKAIEEKEAAAHALRVSLSLVFNRLRRGFETAHPDRYEMSAYRQIEDDINVAKTLKSLLTRIEAPKQKEET